MSRHPRDLAATGASLPVDRYWTQPEAAAYLCVSAAYLRESTCPKVLLPPVRGTKRLVRYCPADVEAWALRWRVA
jgi:hypothetical protein